jgi:hypothetical protein
MGDILALSRGKRVAFGGHQVMFALTGDVSRIPTEEEA